MNKFSINRTFTLFSQKEISKKTFCAQKKINFSKKIFFFKKSSFLSNSCSQKNLIPLASETKMSILEPFFFNFSFDKSRLKSVVSWFFEKYGHYKTILFLEKLKEFGFGYATTGGISLGIDDLKIPRQKIALVSKAETKVAKDFMDYRNARITGIERTQRLIYTWNQTNDMLKQEVLKYFSTMDLFNPIYMMAFSGARGNMSQVRQLVGMRGLMSDPEGQIIDFPIQSNFREGLTLTEYLISTYGARKGIVDTALRTATAGYLTRRLVDVAQHVIISKFDCGTFRGIFLFDMKEANKTIYSFQNRLIGRILAQDIFILKEATTKNSSQKTLLASRNQEIDSKLAVAIAKISKKALVRSPLTCEIPRFICQLCYGWSLSQGKLVSVGEAVGVIAAQSIGEPGTQLTMRTFHTGGVFAGGLTDQILAPFNGRIQYIQNIPGSCIRTSLSEVAFLTKMPGSFFVRGENKKKHILNLSRKSINYEPNFSQIKCKQQTQNFHFSEIYKIPAYAVLYLRNNEIVRKNQVLSQFSTVLKKSFQYGSAEQTLYSNLSGEFILNGLTLPFQKNFSKRQVFYKKLKNTFLMKKNVQFEKNFKENLKTIDVFVEKRSGEFLDISPIELKHDVLWKSKNWTNIWILSGKMINYSFDSNLFFKLGDFITKTSVLNRILWKKKKNWNLSSFLASPSNTMEKISFKKTFDFQKKTNARVACQTKNFFSLLVLKKKNKFKFACYSNHFFPFNNLFDSYNFLFCKVKPINQKAFFMKKSLKKINIQKLCSFQFSKSILANKKSHCKNTFIFFNQLKKRQIFTKKKFSPFSIFLLNFLSSNKKKIKKKKFLKLKKNILFFKTFQKVFFISSRRKQKNLSKKRFKNTIIYKSSQTKKNKLFKIKIIIQRKTNKKFFKKKQLKQIFLKFSGLQRTISFFQFFSFSKIFNTSIKFIKRKFFSKKKIFPSKFFSMKSFFNIYFLNQFLETHFQFYHFKTFCFQFCNSQIKYPYIQNKFFYFQQKNFTNSKKFHYLLLFAKKTNSFFTFQTKNFILKNKFSSFSLLKKQKFIFPIYFQFSFFKSFMFKKKKIFQNLKKFENFKENPERQIFFKKTLFFLDYKKLRYSKYGYIFLFENSLKNKIFSKQINHSFQIFHKIKQSPFDSNENTNPGKKETNISLRNGNFLGKDFPTFLTYYFPKNYQTITNGIFTIFFFAKNFKKQRYSQFYCLKRIFDIAKEKKVYKTTVFKKFNYLLNQTFCFVNKKMHFQLLNSFKNLIQKNILSYNYVLSFKQKHSKKNFSLIYNLITNQKQKKLNAFQFLKKYYFQRFFCFESYTEEIFWTPQENYTVSVLEFYKLQKKKFLSESKQMNNILYNNELNLKQLNNNFHYQNLNFFSKKNKIDDHKNDQYISKIIFNKNPLFYLSNSQGKKKPFFSVLDGIWTYNISSHYLKYKQFNFFKQKKRMFSKKFDKIQQKLSFYKLKKQKNLKKTFSQFLKKKSCLRYFKFQMFKFCEIQNKKHLFFSKKKNIVTIYSKFYFEKIFKQILQRNFVYSLKKKKINYSNFESIKKLFFNEFQKTDNFSLLNKQSLKKTKIQEKIGKKLKTQCFTCIPLKKTKKIQKSIVSFSRNFRNQFEQMRKKEKFSKKTVYVSKTNFDCFRQNISNFFLFPDQRIHFKIQAGWICVFPNFPFLLNWHQKVINLGHFFGKDFCFEQNKIFQETFIFDFSSCFSNFSFQNSYNFSLIDSFKKTQISNRTQFFSEKKQTIKILNIENSKKRKILLCLKFFKINQKIRFSNDASIFACQLFNSFKNSKKQKNIALLLRPMQYKLIENPKNYQRFFFKEIIKNNLTKPDSICFVSSLKIYKKYHSIILNLQKPNKKFIQDIENIELKINKNFQNIYKNKKRQKNNNFEQIIFLQSIRNKLNRYWLNRNQQKHQYDFSKKLSKVPHFQFYSKKTRLLKFQNLLIPKTFNMNKKFEKNKVFFKFLSQSQKAVFFHSHFHLKKPLSLPEVEKMFFSFYPVQFLPLSISNYSFQFAPFKRKNLQLFPTFFLNSLNNKMILFICHKKAAFFNQRFYCFDFINKYNKTTSFWLNNDGKNIYFINSLNKNIWKNFWNTLFFTSTSFVNKENSLKKKHILLQSDIQKKSSIFKNFIFQKNQNFYANTEFLSPFNGELISMHTNELNWWKKASEISTIQKLNTLFTVLTKKDLLSFNLTQPFKKKKTRKKFFSFYKSHFSNSPNVLLEYSLKPKQKNLNNLYKSVLKNQQPIFDSFNYFFKIPQSVSKNFVMNKIIKTKKFIVPEKKNTNQFQISSFVTKYDNKIYKLKNLKIGNPFLSKQPRLGKFIVAGDCILNFAIRKPGQIVHLSFFKITLRRGQPFLVSPKGILHLVNTPYIEKNIPILTLPYQTLQSGDIVQGIPKVEQFFEARTTIQGRLFISSLPILLKGIFQRYKSLLSLEQAVRQSFLKIQQLIVDGVQRVYRLQGVSIVDKHLEVIVRQMTTKVQIIHGAQTGFFPGELVNLHLVERMNKFLMVKIRYEPIVLGITRASLEVDSFLSASSFQQTTKILALASISRKKDFLKGLKENILVGNLIPSGTGYLVLGNNF